MFFNILRGHLGKNIKTLAIPGHLQEYAIMNADARHLEFDQGEVLTQMIQGKFFKLWDQRMIIEEDICVSAYVSDPCITINYTRQGSLYCDMVGYGKVKLEEGTYHLFCVPNSILHFCHFTRGVYHFMHLDLSDDWLYHIDFNPYCKEDLRDYLKDPKKNGKQFATCKIQGIVQDVFRKIAECKIEDKDEFMVFVTHEVIRFLREFNLQIPRLKEGDVEPTKKGFKALKVDEFKAYVANNLEGDLEVVTVAKVLCLSAVTLNRYVKDLCDITAFAYVQGKRMNEARKNLLETELCIKEIGKQLGYAHPCSFAEAYKDFWQITPTEERERHNKGISGSIPGPDPFEK